MSPPPEPPAPPENPRATRLVWLAILVALGLTALDLATKTWAEGRLARERLGDAPALCVPDEDGFIRTQRIRQLPLVVIEGFFELEYAENCGAAFGLLRAAPQGLRRGVFGLAAVIACAALFTMFARGRGGPYFAAAVPLVASGALGNLVDRIRYGYVVDFIHFHYEDAFDYPTFNVADITITLGVICWIIDAVQGGQRAPTPAPERAQSEPSP